MAVTVRPDETLPLSKALCGRLTPRALAALAGSCPADHDARNPRSDVSLSATAAAATADRQRQQNPANTQELPVVARKPPPQRGGARAPSPVLKASGAQVVGTNGTVRSTSPRACLQDETLAARAKPVSQGGKQIDEVQVLPHRDEKAVATLYSRCDVGHTPSTPREVPVGLAHRDANECEDGFAQPSTLSNVLADQVHQDIRIGVEIARPGGASSDILSLRSNSRCGHFVPTPPSASIPVVPQGRRPRARIMSGSGDRNHAQSLLGAALSLRKLDVKLIPEMWLRLARIALLELPHRPPLQVASLELQRDSCDQWQGPHLMESLNQSATWLPDVDDDVVGPPVEGTDARSHGSGSESPALCGPLPPKYRNGHLCLGDMMSESITWLEPGPDSEPSTPKTGPKPEMESHCNNESEEPADFYRNQCLKAIAKQQKAPGLLDGIPKCLSFG